MSDQAVERHNQSDDIDLLALIKSVLSTWKACIVAVVIVTATYAGLTSFNTLRSSDEQIFQKPIKLTFPGAHNLTFANGAKFRYSDIVAPAVVQRVYERNNISAAGISITEFQNGLTSFPFSPQYPVIYEKFSRLMSDKKLSQEQLQQLRQQMTAELEQASRGSAVISWRVKGVNIPKELANRVLSDVPATWADINIKDKGVLQLDVSLATISSLNLDMIKSRDILIIGDILGEKLNVLSKNIESITEFSSAKSLLDTDTGMNLVDLQNAISDLRRYDLGTYLSPAALVGMSDTPQLTQYYFETKLHKLQTHYSSMQSTADGLKMMLDSYAGRSLSTADSGNQVGSTTQLNGDLIDRLTKLSGNAEREIFIKDLTERWLKISDEMAQLQIRIDEAKLIIANLENHTELAKVNRDLFEETQKVVPDIIERISGYYGVFDRITDLLENELNGNAENLYVPITNSVIVEKNIIDIKQTIIYWIMLMILTVVVTIPSVLIARAIRR